MTRMLVAVVCTEPAAAMLVHHRDFEVVWAAPNGTDRSGIERAPAGDENEVVSLTPLLVDYDTAAAALRLSERMIRKLVSTGELPAVSVGRSRRIRRADLERYVENLGDPEPQTTEPTA